MDEAVPVLKIRRRFDCYGVALATALAPFVLWLGWQISPAMFKAFAWLGSIIYLGFSLPKSIGREERMRRARAAKRSELEEWGFHGRDREGPWLNYIDFPLVHYSPVLRDVQFYSEWLIVHKGLIVINPGIATPDLKAGEARYDFSRRRTMPGMVARPRSLSSGWRCWVRRTVGTGQRPSAG